MKDANKWDNIESFLLKECYTLAAQYEENGAARDILRARGKKISIPGGYIPDGSNITLPTSTQQTVSNIIYALTMEGAAGTTSDSFRAQHEISSMPNCGDKEFLLAIMALRNGRSETQRLEALRHVSLALSYSPNDPRYIALAKILQQINR